MKLALLEQHTATDKKIEKIELDTIITKGLQTRAGTDPAKVAEYAEIYKAGGPMPPIVVFSDGGDEFYLGDGNHRVLAARKADLSEIEGLIKKGDRRAALWYATAANAQHGLPRTNEDKRKAVGLILMDDEWRQLSDAQIAEHAQVSDRLIAKVRKELGAEVKATKGKDGKVRQKPVDRETRKAARHDIGEIYTQTLGMLASEGSGFSGLHGDKLAILAAIYAANRALDRDEIRAITGKGPDTHLAGLAKKGMIRGWPDKQITLDPKTLIRVGEVLDLAHKEPAKPVKETSSQPADADQEFQQFLARSHALESRIWRTLPQLAAIDPGPYTARILIALVDWPASTDYPVSRAHLVKYSRLNLRAVTELLPALAPVLRETPSTEEYYLDDELLAAIKDALFKIDAKHPECTACRGSGVSHQPGRQGFTCDECHGTGSVQSSGPEDITEQSSPKSLPAQAPAPVQESPAPAKPEKPAPPQTKGDLILIAERDLISVELLKGKPQWTGTDNDLLALALIVGVPTRKLAWIDSVRANAQHLFIDALRSEVADRVRNGEHTNRGWPVTPELCRLWGLDYHAIHLRAQHQVEK
jgi:hypothetical protein